MKIQEPGKRSNRYIYINLLISLNRNYNETITNNFTIILEYQYFAQQTYDIVIVGGTPGGLTTALAAAKLGKTSVILERTQHIGGLPSNGLGATDIVTRAATTGLFREFTCRIKDYYKKIWCNFYTISEM